jgi:tetratricopeptide (TPR) repeat protein
MSRTLNDYLVFIATPSGLKEEREAFKEVLESYNLADANQRGYSFTPVGWEITLGGTGRPQALINQDIRQCDYFVLILHDRWGTPPGPDSDGRDFSSGTEEEFNVACEALAAGQIREIILFFKHVDEKKLSDPGDQLKAVLKFRKDREDKKDFLYHTFDDEKPFENLLRRHLSSWLRSLEGNNTNAPLPIINGGKGSSVRRPYTLNISSDLSSNSAKEAVNAAESRAEAGKILEAEVLFSQIVSSTDDPWVLVRYGRFLRKIGHLVTAKEVLQRAVELSDFGKNKEIEAYAHKQLGLIAARTVSPQSGIAQLQKAAIIYTECGATEDVAKCQREMGLIYNKLGRHQEAISAFSEASELLKSSKNELAQASMLGFLGVSYRSQGNLDLAEKYQRGAQEIVERLNDLRSSAPVWGNLGNLLRQRGKFEEALQLNEKSLAAYLTLGDKQGLAREHSNVGTSLRVMGRIDEAESHYNESLALAEALGNRQGIAIQLSNLGLIAARQGSFDEAERLHIRALDIFAELRSVQYEAMQFENIARVYRKQGLFEKSKLSLDKAREIFINGKFPQGLASVELELGLLKMSSGAVAEGRSHVERAVNSFEKLGLEADFARAKRALSGANADL